MNEVLSEIKVMIYDCAYRPPVLRGHLMRSPKSIPRYCITVKVQTSSDNVTCYTKTNRFCICVMQASYSVVSQPTQKWFYLIYNKEIYLSGLSCVQSTFYSPQRDRCICSSACSYT